jgi:uncharacterized membrane protein YhaH (DUF805 family)
VPSPLSFSGRAEPDEFFGTWVLCQIAGVFFGWITLGSDLVVRDSGEAAFFASLLGPFVLANIPFVAVAFRRGRDAGVWAIFLVLPGLLIAPCGLFAIAGLAAIIAPNHPWYYWHAIGGLAFTSLACIVVLSILGSRPSKSNAPAPSELTP